MKCQIFFIVVRVAVLTRPYLSRYSRVGETVINTICIARSPAFGTNLNFVVHINKISKLMSNLVQLKVYGELRIKSLNSIKS